MRFPFKAIKECVPLLNLRPISFHFNAIKRPVSANMADDCMALKTIETSRIPLPTGMG
jgi:hypothetical protein